MSGFVNYKTKKFRQDNYFILYTLDDHIVAYFDNFKELSKIFNYDIRNIVHELNKHKSDRLIIIINNKKYMLVTFTDEG